MVEDRNVAEIPFFEEANSIAGYVDVAMRAVTHHLKFLRTLMRGAVYLGWNYPLSRWFVFSAQKGAAPLSAR